MVGTRAQRACYLLAVAAMAAGAGLVATGAGQRFYDDDPLWQDDDAVEDASRVQPWVVQDAYDAVENTFGEPGDKAPDVRAGNVNTVDEVPDSSWFTNRVGSRRMDADEIERGGWASQGPADGRWVVTEGKSDGISPGFTITDPDGARWFLKFDADEHPGMASGSEVATSRLFWALGYNVPEYHVVMVKRAQLAVGAGARVQPPGAFERDMKDGDLDLLLADAARNGDGSYRAVASRALPGRPLGAFRFHGTRPDDPNDIVPHEHRRELRGLLVFSAWLNHVEVRGSNTLDTLVSENGRSFVRHHLLDFGASLGSGTLAPRHYWEGYDYLVDVGQAAKGMASFGFYILPWRRVPFHESPVIGRFPSENGSWDPEEWKPRFPNAAFRHARADDKFWAASKLAAVTDELIRVAIQDGHFPDQQAEDFLVQALAERRQTIARTYLTAVSPIVDAALDDSGLLTFRNAAVQAGVAAAPARYEARWSLFDNATGEVSPLGESAGAEPRLQAPAGLPGSPGTFVRVDIAAVSAEHPAWQSPAHAYFRRLPAGGWKLVGFERLPSTTS
jgi:hypothetical protein